MVDFNKRLQKAPAQKPLSPIEIYDTLDRASDKGPLRPVQLEVLSTWHDSRRSERDLIVKLHTGQGKTLIGLLMLQSKLNEGIGPAVYLCPDNYLVSQTCLQAKQFGISYCTADPELPDAFREGSTILITSVQKLFNGLTRFGLGPRSVPIGTLLMDDSHACIDAIRDAVTIRIEKDKDDEVYQQLLNLFTVALGDQGEGTFADIRNGSRDEVLPVPYWNWRERHKEVVEILSKHKSKMSIKFAWPILKDVVPECQCIVSGAGLEIMPYLPPLDLFGSFWDAKHRVFMSATVTDDAFLVRGLRLKAETIRTPLGSKNEKWSGEKMILIPSLIDEHMDRSTIVNEFGKPQPGRKHGVVVLVRGFKNTKDWEATGARVATKDTIADEIESLRNGKLDSPLVMANRYDGIDLPDDMCRLLVVDSLPFSENLSDSYANVAVRRARSTPPASRGRLSRSWTERERRERLLRNHDHRS